MDKASKIFLAGHTGLVGQQFIEEGIKISMITKKLQLKIYRDNCFIQFLLNIYFKFYLVKSLLFLMILYYISFLEII